MIAAWIAKNFEDRDRLDCACEWQRRLGRVFIQKIEQRLLQVNRMDNTWMRAWRLFCLVEPDQPDELVYHVTGERLNTSEPMKSPS